MSILKLTRIALQTTLEPVIIRAEGVSKLFSSHIQQQISLRHEAQRVLKDLFRRRRIPADEHPGKFYALKDISFEIRRGESVGIIGRNGSGKTTLLRLMSGIMRPTFGRLEVNGRFTALIGLGTGFNPVMTGRENIYLSAAIYGLKKDAIREIVEPIVEFADIGRFIDAPVKEYSSGMVARLGFSVAVHVLPDIVFLDEVLAVGDVNFQRKCNERMAQLHGEGRSLVMVSHSHEAITQMCQRTIWIDRGILMSDGPSGEVIERYLEAMAQG
jgi:lipopolysaccharide transport system ATP-binding protein